MYYEREYIEENEKSEFDEAALCVDDTMDPGWLVGAGDHTFLPGYCRQLGHHGGLQGVKSGLVGPADDRLCL